MNPLLQKLVDIASGQVGVKEEGGNNKGPFIRLYQGATWLQPGPWPWCAAFCAWVLREWLVKANGAIEAVGIKDDETSGWRCQDASAFGWITWAKKRGLYVTDEKELAKAGDFVVFDFSHIGICVRDQQPGETVIHTIEGNTNVAGTRDSLTGDGVATKVRATNLVRAYIRILK